MRSAGARTLSRMCTPSANVNLNVDGPSSSAKEDHRSEPHLRKFGFLSEKEDLPAWPGPVRPGISRFIPDSFGLHRYPGKHFSNRDSRILKSGHRRANWDSAKILMLWETDNGVFAVHSALSRRVFGRGPAKKLVAMARQKLLD